MTDSTEQRIAQLERDLARTKSRFRRLFAVTVGTLILGVILSWGGRGHSPNRQNGDQLRDTVRATTFLLETRTGELRAELRSADTGPHLILYSPNGSKQIRLGAPEGVPVVGLYDQQGVARAVLSAGQVGPALTLNASTGMTRVALGVKETEDIPPMILMDQTGGVRAGIIEFDSLGARLSLRAENGRETWTAPPPE